MEVTGESTRDWKKGKIAFSAKPVEGIIVAIRHGFFRSELLNPWKMIVCGTGWFRT